MDTAVPLTAYDLLTFLADAGFADAARKHDELLSLACARMDAEKRDVPGFMHFSRSADVVKAAMRLQWPDASKTWFNED